MSGWMAIGISVPLTLLAAWFGGRFHALVANTHLRVQTMLSFVGGLMLGMALLHLLPHAAVQLVSLDRAIYGMLCGIIGTFLLMRFLHVHSHEPGIACADTDGHDHSRERVPGEDADDSGHAGGQPSSSRAARLRWVTLLTGLGLHSVVDGVAIASAVRLAESHGGWPGLGVLIVVLLHKPLDAVSLTGTMAVGGESASRRKLVNLAFAFITPISTIIAYAGLAAGGAAAGFALAIAAGAFVCVALADLMPEVQFHSHHRLRLTLALLAGVSLAAAIGFFEEHSHEIPTQDPHAGHDHAAGDPAGLDLQRFGPTIHA